MTVLVDSLPDHLITGQPAEFVVQPNAAFNRTGWPWIFGLLSITCLSIAIRFAWLGYWMILPFAIMDVFAVGMILYLISYRSAYVEIIRVGNDSVEIYHAQRNKDRQWLFPSCWTRVRLESPGHRWYPHRLLIGCKGQWVEVGGCLTNPERLELAKAIETEIRCLVAWAHKN